MAFIAFFLLSLPASFLDELLLNAYGIFKALSRQLDDLSAGIEDLKNQFFIDTATWSLSKWESEFGIQLVDQSNTAARRNNVMAMSRGGLGATPDNIKGILLSYGYETEIDEDYPNYQITIKFTDKYGIPSNMNDLKAILRRMIPGHIAVNYSYLYHTYSDYDNGSMTYQTLDNSGLEYGDLSTKMPS